MRRSSALRASAPTPPAESHVWLTLKTLFPYLWAYRLRVALALSCLVGAKVANVGVPMVFKEMIDRLSVSQQALVMPAALLLLYGALRFSTALFTELREILFARVTQRAVRPHRPRSLPPPPCPCPWRFHLERQTGGVSRDIERGTRSISRPDQLHPLFHPAHPGRDFPGPRHPLRPLRHRVRRHRRHFPLRLHPVHGQGQQLAHRHPAHGERVRLRRQQPAPSTACSITRR